ncbi:hypothetical protein ILUMI_16679 [Ignelater luminosus]|uniref:CCHC-type domain-containing protein n=1 Tax=Ignelater luminosus TaxID=2038154 RepID=A0A8K0CLA8_IGNLU|nr:hypothetical protein ILUMI_16679 [Ignelater luminosus]
MQIYLKAKGWFHIIQSQKGKDDKKESNNNEKAQAMIISSIDKTVLVHLMNCSTASEMWSKLVTLYEQKSTLSVYLLQQQFFDYKFKAKGVKDVSQKCYGCGSRNHIRVNCPQNADNNTNYVNRQINGYQPLRFQRGNQHLGNNNSQQHGYQYLEQQRGQYNGHGDDRGAQRGNH